MPGRHCTLPYYQRIEQTVGRRKAKWSEGLHKDSVYKTRSRTYAHDSLTVNWPHWDKRHRKRKTQKGTEPYQRINGANTWPDRQRKGWAPQCGWNKRVQLLDLSRHLHERRSHRCHTPRKNCILTQECISRYRMIADTKCQHCSMATETNGHISGWCPTVMSHIAMRRIVLLPFIVAKLGMVTWLCIIMSCIVMLPFIVAKLGMVTWLRIMSCIVMLPFIVAILGMVTWLRIMSCIVMLPFIVAKLGMVTWFMHHHELHCHAALHCSQTWYGNMVYASSWAALSCCPSL